MSKSANTTEDKPTVALVLGSGGARGLAHIGAIEAIEAAGYRINSIAGTSIGALVGGIHAAGRLAEYRDWVCALERRDVLRLLDFAFGHPGLIKGERVIGAMKELVGEHCIEELSMPFTAVATDLEGQREVWITEGPLFDAIRASIAIPMVFTPHTLHGRELVDGGLLAPMPIAATRRYKADLVVAVDVNDRVPAALRDLPHAAEAAQATDPLSAENGEPGLKERVAAWFESLFPDRPAQPAQPGLLDLMARSLDTVQAQISRVQLAMDPPDLLIRVPRDACLFYEFWRAEELIVIGREAGERALAQANERSRSRNGRS
ncbi:patatin-like phospholipase family protein [Pseudomarimonas arenosa]|uniref:Patatin-like phospholipase family protein n=1 Tax=Pseudomarimonas arenosa TaxID=2774145 RepID=A0AAW3ZHJ2_9GAMM|nr:patatin-like phospholipase family protein [Pseudomarimonas arenosa]MBD8525478.1 patatin-like phospholipase family protein [Pseudomarimonas arenosa]